MAATYTVSLSNFCGTATDNFVLQTKSCNCYLYIPNAFTPTGDGLNECFKAVYNCEFEHFQLYIYNRWGQLVYETQNPTDCWDGKYKNSFTEPGVYVYLLEYKSIYNAGKEVRKGRITVVRCLVLKKLTVFINTDISLQNHFRVMMSQQIVLPQTVRAQCPYCLKIFGLKNRR